jgi:hypothetical protein
VAFQIKQNDTRPIYIAALKDNYGTPDEGPINLSADGTTVRFIMRKRGTPTAKVNAAATIVNGVGGIVSYSWDGMAGDTDEAGTFDVEFEITHPDGGVETVPNVGYLEVIITDDLG